MEFEEAIRRLEEIVRRLENGLSGDMGLEEAINLFEEGIALHKMCTEKLESVAQRIERLVEKEGKVERVPEE